MIQSRAIEQNLDLPLLRSGHSQLDSRVTP
jgi:hypothetical protein